MVKDRVKKVHTLKVKVNTLQEDIENGECRLTSRCMEKVSTTRALAKMFPEVDPRNFHVRVDAGHIKFNLGGYRWQADTPKIAKAALIHFDMPETFQAVKPHQYTFVAVRKAKVQVLSQKQIDANNAGRNLRRAENGGQPTYGTTLRERIVGFDLKDRGANKNPRRSTVGA